MPACRLMAFLGRYIPESIQRNLESIIEPQPEAGKFSCFSF